MMHEVLKPVTINPDLTTEDLCNLYAKSSQIVEATNDEHFKQIHTMLHRLMPMTCSSRFNITDDVLKHICFSLSPLLEDVENTYAKLTQDGTIVTSQRSDKEKELDDLTATVHAIELRIGHLLSALDPSEYADVRERLENLQTSVAAYRKHCDAKNYAILDEPKGLALIQNIDETTGTLLVQLLNGNL